MEHHDIQQPPARPLTRRSMTGLAWSAPVIALSVATPASAASAPASMPGLRFVQSEIHAAPGATFSIQLTYRGAAGQVTDDFLMLSTGPTSTNGYAGPDDPGPGLGLGLASAYSTPGVLDTTAYAPTDATGLATFTGTLAPWARPGDVYDLNSYEPGFGGERIDGYVWVT